MAKSGNSDAMKKHIAQREKDAKAKEKKAPKGSFMPGKMKGKC